MEIPSTSGLEKSISMGSRPLTFTVGTPIPAARAVPSPTNVVPFNERGRPRAKFKLITSTRPSKAAIPSSSAAAGGSTSGSYSPKGVIIDFPHTDRGGHATKWHKYQSIENETGLTLADFAAMAYVVMSVTFYPALAFLFLP
jgi:hypothetical protein